MDTIMRDELFFKNNLYSCITVPLDREKSIAFTFSFVHK